MWYIFNKSCQKTMIPYRYIVNYCCNYVVYDMIMKIQNREVTKKHIVKYVYFIYMFLKYMKWRIMEIIENSY